MVRFRYWRSLDAGRDHKPIPLTTRFRSLQCGVGFVLEHWNALVDLLDLGYVARESARRHRVSEPWVSQLNAFVLGFVSV
jgi:hypothetical protein